MVEKDDFCGCWNAHARHDIGVDTCRKGRGLMSCNIFDMRMALVCQEHDCCSWIEVGDNFWSYWSVLPSNAAGLEIVRLKSVQTASFPVESTSISLDNHYARIMCDWR